MRRSLFCLPGGFTEAADADLTDAQLRAAGRHRSARQLPTYAKRTRKRLIAVAQKAACRATEYSTFVTMNG
jgi:hypothetical protein